MSTKSGSSPKSSDAHADEDWVQSMGQALTCVANVAVGIRGRKWVSSPESTKFRDDLDDLVAWIGELYDSLEKEHQ